MATTSSSSSPSFFWTGPTLTPLKETLPSASYPLISIPPSVSTSTPITVPGSSTTTPVNASDPTSSQQPPPPKVPITKPKTKAKATLKTLATNPEDFEKENLKVQRDALRLKLTEQDVHVNDMKEKLEILTTRCRLFEQDRNERAYNSIDSPIPTPKTSLQSPAPSPSVVHVPSISQTAIASLINLEVLRAVKASAAGYPPPPPHAPSPPQSPSAPHAHPCPSVTLLEIKLAALEASVVNKIDSLKHELTNTFVSLISEHFESQSQSNQIPNKDPTPTQRSVSTSTSTDFSEASSPEPSHESPGISPSPTDSVPSPSEHSQTTSSKSKPKNSISPKKKSKSRAPIHPILPGFPKPRRVLLGDPPKHSYLGPPPGSFWIPGRPIPHSQSFNHHHG